MNALRDMFDDDFWEWYQTYGPSFLLSHRLDILRVMHDAYEDMVILGDGDNYKVVGLASEIMEAFDKIPPTRKIQPEPISDKEIELLEQSLQGLSNGKEEK